MTERDAELYRRAGQLFDELCEAVETERAAGLARAFERDPEAAELARRMLERDASGGPLAEALLEGFDESDPAGVLGRAVGRYVIEALVGRGGMGAVYRGRRTDPDAQVAIKFITLSAARAAALERFKSEARLLARLDHPGVVRYRDSGVDDRGRPYLAMDMVEGEPLAWSIEEVREDVERAVAVVVAIAEAVHHLHQRRVLHRDLKPSNVIVKRDGRALVPVVIDLGIARALADPDLSSDSGTPDPALTGSLGLGPVGTPAFMSPEQARADGVVDVRTDVHGLGAVLYALLTGHPPRELDRPAARDPLEFHRRLQETEARPPSQSVDAALLGASAARRRARRIDRDLDAIVLKAVALEPNERYGSAEAFAADLLRWIGGLPVSARLVGPLGRFRRLVRRRPLETLSGVVAVVLLVGALIAIVQSRAGEVAAQARHREQLVISREMNRFFTEDVLLRAMPELDGPEMPVLDVLRAAAESSANGVERQPVVAVSIDGALMEVFERIGAGQEADEALARAAPLAQALERRDPQRLRFEIQRGTVLAWRSQWAEAQATLRQVIEVLDEVPGAFPDLETRAAGGLGHALLSAGELDAAEPWLERALALAENERAPETPRNWEVLSNVAILAWSRGDYDDAVTAFEELLVAFEAQFGEGSPYALGVLANLAGVHLDRRRPNEGLPHARKAVAMADELFEATHPDRLSALNQLASCLSSAGSLDEAIALRREVYEGRLARFGPDNPAVGVAANNLASTLVFAGRNDEAAEPAEAALATLLETLGDAHPTTAGAYLTLAVIEANAGNRDLSLGLFDAAIEVYELAEGDHSVAIEQALARRKLVEAGAGR